MDQSNLCVTDQSILRSEGQGNGGTFKGIFVRYVKLLINECGRTEFLPWMKTNADTAWSKRLNYAVEVIQAFKHGHRIQSFSATGHTQQRILANERFGIYISMHGEYGRSTSSRELP